MVKINVDLENITILKYLVQSCINDFTKLEINTKFKIRFITSSCNLELKRLNCSKNLQCIRIWKKVNI